MKRTVILTAIAVILFTVSAKAQFFVGGGFDLSTNGSSSQMNNTKVKGESKISFNFSPRAGMVISDNLLAGVSLEYNILKTNNRQDPGTIFKSSSFSFSPFVDYTLIELGKFELAAEAQVPFNFNWGSTSTGNTETKHPSKFRFGISAVPLLFYNINDNLKLNTSLNFMRLYFSINRSSIERDGVKSSNTDTAFNFGVNTDNLINIGAITIGAMYLF